MKKLFLLTLIITAFATNTFAQSTGNIDPEIEAVFKKYRFGLYIGPTFNSLKSTAKEAGNYTVDKGSGRVSFNAGLNMELNLTEKYTLYTGIGMDWNGGTMIATQKPGTTIDPDFARKATIDYKNQYLTIPLGLKMYAADFGAVRIFAQTGMELSILLSQRGTYSIVANDSSVNTKSELVKLNGFGTTTPFNIGWHIGAGAEYALANGSAAYLAILYRNGFIDYTSPGTNNNGFKFDDGNIRSNTIAIRVGYFF